MNKIQSIPRAATETENDNERTERIDVLMEEQAIVSEFVRQSFSR